MKSIRKYLSIKVIVAIFFIILGVIMMLKPHQVVSLITFLFGIGLLIIGGCMIVADLLSKELFSRTGLLMQGVLFIVLGIALLIYPGIGNVLLPLSIGGLIIADGIMRLQIGSLIRHVGGSSYLTALSVLTIILGVICIFNPKISSAVITGFLGIMMIVEAVASLADTYYVKKYIKEIDDNIIDV